MKNASQDARDKGLISFYYQEDWLEKAIRQHNPKVTLMLARTEPVRFKRLDFMDFAILYKEPMN